MRKDPKLKRVDIRKEPGFVLKDKPRVRKYAKLFGAMFDGLVNTQYTYKLREKR